MSAGRYDRTVDALRDLTMTITWNPDDPVDLTPYDRFIYNIQSTESPTVEVLTADSDDDPTWIFRVAPYTDGKIRISIPGVDVPYVPSSSGYFEHELVVLDSLGGRISLFRGKVKLRPPIAAIT